MSGLLVELWAGICALGIVMGIVRGLTLPDPVSVFVGICLALFAGRR